MDKETKRRSIADIVKTALSALIVACGAYFAMPSSGMISTFPVAIIAVFIAFLIKREAVISVCCAFLSSALLSMFTENGFLYSLVFAVLYTVCVMAAFYAAGVFAKKASKRYVPAVIALAVAVFLQAFFAGVPWKFISESDRAEEYIKGKYVNQDFTDIKCRFDRFSGNYTVSVYYPLDENTLCSEIVMSEPVKDGFYAALMQMSLEKQRGILLGIIREKTVENYTLLPVSAGIENEKGEVALEYGQEIPDDIKKSMKFELTFGDPMSQIRIFSSKCREYFGWISASGFEYGSIEFIAEDRGGNRIFSCTVTPDTKDSDIVSICRNLLA